MRQTTGFSGGCLIVLVCTLLWVTIGMLVSAIVMRCLPESYHSFWGLSAIDSEIIWAGVLVGIAGGAAIGGKLIAIMNHQSGDKCLRCGYDLHATPTRCPECGLVPEKFRISN
jgi:hypothetical protein